VVSESKIEGDNSVTAELPKYWRLARYAGQEGGGGTVGGSHG
jgi:hypothetical protein